jgi:hypothetical protein
MTLFIDQLLLLAAIAALSAAAWRLASMAVPSGLLRAIGTVALAAGGAVLSAMGLALVGLGASAVALALVAVGVWLVVRRLVAASPPSAGDQLTAWWGGLPAAGRVARVAVAGAFVGYVAWILRHPGLGLDALTYHLALPVDWAHNGRPGSLVAVNDGLPIQNYPLTWEVLVAWFTGIGHTLVPAMLVTPGALVLLGASVRAGLAEMGVSGRLAWLAAAALATLPIVVIQLPGPNNDLPEMAWLACAAALVAGVAARRAVAGAAGRRAVAGAPAVAGVAGRERPGLLAVALIAVGLCVGTKTTGAPLAALALVLGGWACRRELRRVARLLVLAAVVAAVIGGVWYVRNLIDHGSPFWPLSTTPWGDPIPAPFRAVDVSLLNNFHATLHARTDAYWRVLAGGVILVVGAVASVLWATRGAAKWGALVVVATLLIWAASPYTGISSSTQLAIGATRYLLPCMLAAAVVVALAARGAGALRGGVSRRGAGALRGGVSRRGAVAEVLSALVLLGALAVNIDRDAPLGFPNAPPVRLLLIAAAVAAAVAVVAELGVRARDASAWLTRWGASLVAGVVAVAALATLLVPVNGYMTSHAGTGLFDAGLVRWLDSRAAFRHGHEPVLIGPVTVAVLTGARLAHPLILLPGDDRCATLVRQARDAWVVMEIGPTAVSYARHWVGCLPGRRAAYLDGNFLVFAPPALRVAA